MNIFVRVKLFAVCLFAVCILLSALCMSNTTAQSRAPRENSARPPRIESSAATAPLQTLSPREKREQAYTKLLEGQRRLMSAGAEPADSVVRSAMDSFQQAAALDPTLAEAHTALAEIAFYASDLDTSMREADAATRIDRDNLGAHRLLSRVYAIKSELNSESLDHTSLDRRFIERGIAAAREVTRLNPADAEAWALLAEFYKATGQTNDAIDALTKWAAAPAATDPRFFQFATGGHSLAPDAAAAQLGEALLHANRSREALASIRRAVALAPDNKNYIELLGRALEAVDGNSANALQELQRLASADSSNIAIAQLLARTQARAGRVDEAVATLKTAIARRSNSDQNQQQLRLSLAQIYADAARYSDAIAIYESLLKDRGITDKPLVSPDQRELAAGLFEEIISLQKNAGRSSDALATIERARLVLGASDPTADVQLIEFLRAQGKRREALEAARGARQRFPQLIGLEAETLTDLGRVDEAVALLRTRLSGSAKDVLIYRTIAALYIQAGRGREAVESARKTLELATASGNSRLTTEALVTLSSAQQRAGDAKGSEESLRRVIAREPDNATALNNLGYFLLERNERFPEALALIQKAVRAEPTNSSFLDSLGWAYFKLGKLDDAERQLNEAARRAASSATIQDHLGDLYQRQGKIEQARAAWQKALALSTEAAEVARITAKLKGRTN